MNIEIPIGIHDLDLNFLPHLSNYFWFLLFSFSFPPPILSFFLSFFPTWMEQNCLFVHMLAGMLLRLFITRSTMTWLEPSEETNMPGSCGDSKIHVVIATCPSAASLIRTNKD